MLVLIHPSAQAEEINQVSQILKKISVGHLISKMKDQTVIGLEGKLTAEQQAELSRSPAVQKLVPMTTPFKLTSRQFQPEDTVIRVGGIEIGGNAVILMAGPCAIESEEQIDAIAGSVKISGATVLRGSAFKPRSSPYSFQGMGEEGLKLHKRAQEKHGLVTETEVMDVRDVALVAEHVDIIRIGARNMQNFDLLKAVAKSGRPVILKRGISATIEEWLLAAEYLMAHGNPNVILCERGIRTFETATRSTLDLSSIPVLKKLTHLPIIVDPSHAAGRKDIIPALSQAAIAAGADGLLIEVHHMPESAKCDGKQALLPEDLADMMPGLRKVAVSVGRSL